MPDNIHNFTTFLVSFELSLRIVFYVSSTTATVLTFISLFIKISKLKRKLSCAKCCIINSLYIEILKFPSIILKLIDPLNFQIKNISFKRPVRYNPRI